MVGTDPDLRSAPMRKFLVALAILFGVSSTAPAQDAGATGQPAQQSPTFRSGVDLLTVDVGVIDSTGKPVDDLHAPDFIVKIDGQVRRVQSVNLVRIDHIHLSPDLSHGVESRLMLVVIIGVLILVIAAVNFVNLTTARSARRALEVGVRKVAGRAGWRWWPNSSVSR